MWLRGAVQPNRELADDRLYPVQGQDRVGPREGNRVKEICDVVALIAFLFFLWLMMRES